MSEDRSALHVLCRPSESGEPVPVRFALGPRELDVVDIIDRWLDPDHAYFKVRGDDGGVYILRHDVSQGRWELKLFDAGRYRESRLSST
ncbi:MAG: hypothetical protein P8124_04310 [Gammaproteobacteria bacterium]